MTVTLNTEPKPTLTLDLTPEEVNRIIAAQRQGMDLSALFQVVIARLPEPEKVLLEGEVKEGLHPNMTFAELLAPLREDFQTTGMTDEELGEFVDKVVAKVRSEFRTRED